MTAPTTNAHRQELDAEIKKRDALRAELAGIQAAQEKILTRISELRKNLRNAETAFEEAKRESVSNLVHEAMGEAHADQPSMRQLRADMASVEDELEAAKEAKDALDTRQKHIDSRLSLAEMGARRALNEVIKTSPEVGQLIEETKVLEGQIIERISQISYLVERLHLGSDIFESLALKPACTGGLHFPTPARSWAFLAAEKGNGIPAAWQAAVAGLDKDASFPLPGVDGSTLKKGPLRKLMGGA